MRCVAGVQSMLATQDLLLTDESLMATIGFNAVQVRHGSTRRGVSRRTRPVAFPAKVYSGQSDYTSEATAVPVDAAADTVAVYQNEAGHFALESGGGIVTEGAHHGGWLGVEGADGKGLAVLLSHPWQTYPKALRWVNNGMAVDLWPAEADFMGFECEDIMPGAFLAEGRRKAPMTCLPSSYFI